MNDKQLLVSFILDRSGSMNGIWKDVLGGFNQYRDDRRKDDGDTWLTLTTFDTVVETPWTAWNVNDLPDLTNEIASPRGGTALLDAVGSSVATTEQWLSENSWFDGRVILVIFTDGQENSSTEWTKDKVADRVKEKEAAGWAVVYLGANQDSWASGSGIGIANAAATGNWVANAAGTAAVMDSLSSSTANYRSTGNYVHEDSK